MAKRNRKSVKASEVKANPEAGKAEAPAEPRLSKAELHEKLLFKAYHGPRKTERAVEGVTGSQLNAAIVASVLKQARVHFTEAEARDGTIIRAYNRVGDEECRIFLSYKGKYSGKFGVSGKVRALMETAMPQESFGWEQQGSKNYWFSANCTALVSFLGG